MGGGKKYALPVLGLLCLVMVLAYYELVYRPEQMKSEQMKEPYRQAGLSEEQIDEFFRKYPQQNGNSTWVEFAKAWAENEELSEKAFNMFMNLRDSLSYLSFVRSGNYKGLDFLNEYPQFIKDYQIALPFYSSNTSLFRTIYHRFLNDPQITVDRNALTLEALKLYSSLNLANMNLSLPTIHALNNLTIAEKQLGLPLHDKNTLWLLINCTQKQEGEYLMDFAPIVFKSVDGNHVYLVPNPARGAWLTCEVLKRIRESGFEIEKHPEMFLGLNGKIIANAFCIFDEAYGISYTEKEVNKRTINVTDEDVLSLIMLQWNLYSKFAPQLNGSEKLYNRDFPWYNSTELEKLYPDRNELRVALFKLFYLPDTTYSIKEGKRVFGIKAAETSLRDAMGEYEIITSLYPNGTIGRYDEDPRDFFYGWLGDRAGWGLINTVSQFVGVDLSNIEFPRSWIEWIELVKYNNGLDGYLTKNWKYWDLVKFIVGYERFRNHGDECETIQFKMPEVLRIFGFPTDLTMINPAPLGAGGVEWCVSLPLPIANSLKQQFSNSNILLGPGYTFGLFSSGDGLIKERGLDEFHKPIENGITKVFQWVGDKRVYLMKRD